MFFLCTFKNKNVGAENLFLILPLILTFTPINSELRKNSNDQMTAKTLIINTLSGH